MYIAFLQVTVQFFHSHQKLMVHNLAKMYLNPTMYIIISDCPFFSNSQKMDNPYVSENLLKSVHVHRNPISNCPFFSLSQIMDGTYISKNVINSNNVHNNPISDYPMFSLSQKHPYVSENVLKSNYVHSIPFSNSPFFTLTTN
jgi:hypothetical protein